MQITAQGALLDLCVLSIIERKDTYGYLLTSSVKALLDVSESTVYPVMRRLMGQSLLETYDVPHDGRNRRYYKLTESGSKSLRTLKNDWYMFRDTIDEIVKDKSPEQEVERT